jgi:CubicO group peptidase (beta-lactamase class C family)
VYLFVENEPLVDVTSYNHTWGGAAGSLVSTLDDLTRFWRALQSGELLAPAQFAEMQATVAAVGLDEVIPGLQYGLGRPRRAQISHRVHPTWAATPSERNPVPRATESIQGRGALEPVTLGGAGRAACGARKARAAGRPSPSRRSATG